MGDTPQPKSIRSDAQRQELTVEWADERVQHFPFVFLRGECRCAQCVDEFTGRRILDPATIPADLQVQNIQKVGNYAIRIAWSDGHDTGLYTWRHLRGLDPDGADKEPGGEGTQGS